MILLINTSLSGVSLVLNDKFKHINSEKQSLDLPTETEIFLNENGIKWSDLTAIGVVVGPGSFTGIRLGIAYAKGLAIGLNIPVIPINAFEIYLSTSPDAFVAIDTGRGDLFVSAHDIEPCTMTIDEVEPRQMDYPKTVGHIPYNLKDAIPIITRKLNKKLEPVVPMYLRPSYAEIQKCSQN
ncbi:MAG: tRNA (adenosine(37)-N6)-threonylcarbamoyltransferase complex dimerization subunit type 1 TsaB [Alphaproteobacteria bacterium]|nr:tRNA (adenosine(37)-N6)-threonylcarbamoyltransferase complex dimerization subunit type 1 TsaB [Alphaproteobacteria bacterium]MBN2675195.1 tRNA (adenosine(37)-N6)-threonylcarbamoyltransferase complex dimerization subunit type 1 TsaB [Alphaproteobacteria bacterium]